MTMTRRESANRFLTQACCGTIMALHRVGNEDPEFYNDSLVVMLTSYFNKCWNSLLRGDDPYVLEFFTALNHDKPVCVFKALFALGTNALPTKPPAEVQHCTVEDTEQLENTRVIISNHLQNIFEHLIGIMRAFDAAFNTPSTTHTLTCPPGDCISSVRFSPPDCPVAVLGATSWDKTCRVWQVNHNGQGGNIQSNPMALTQHDSPILDMTFSMDGRAFFGGCSKTGVMWNLVTNQSQVVASHDLPISCISYVNPGNTSDMLLTGSWDGKLRFWDLRQPRPAKEENLGEPIFSMDAQKASPMAACVTGRKVHVFDLRSLMKVNELLPPPVVKFNFRCVSCSPQKDAVAVGTSEGRASYMYLAQQPGCTFRAHIAVDDSRYTMYQTNFAVVHPSKPTLFTGGGDGKVTSWSIKTKSNVARIESEVRFENKGISISAGDLSADGCLLAYAHSYDWAMGKQGFAPNAPHSILIQSTRPKLLSD